MKNFWKKNKIILAIMIFLVVIAPLFYWSFLMMTKMIQAKADLIQEKIIDSGLEKAKVGKIPEMEKANMDFENNKSAVGTILNSNNKVEFIEYVEALAQETDNKIVLKVLDDNNSGNSISDTKTKVVAKKTSAALSDEKKGIESELVYRQYISIRVDLEGNYAGFLNFIHKLENSKYYVNILSFDLQKVFIKNENLATDKSAVSREIFLSPINQNSNSINNSEDSSNDTSELKSSFNIVVYTE
ncbi:MAG: hypothetical protein WC848_00485 [Parcubacteria group bacterium]|jgi:hypothetical protein